MTDPTPSQSDPDAEAALNQAQQAIDQLVDEAAEASEASEPAPGADPADATASPAPVAEPAPPPGPEPARNVDLPNFQQVLADVEASGLDLLQDVDLNVKIELGRTDMLVEDVLRLAEGSVVELDKLAGDPVDIYVNERLVARGEVLVLNDNFCVRISEIVGEEGAILDEPAEQAPRADDQPAETVAAGTPQ